MTTRLAARTRLAAYLDDADNVRWTTAELDDALATAQQLAWQIATNATPEQFTQETTATATLGVISLTGIHRIISVSLGSTGSLRLPIPRVNATAMSAKHLGSDTVNICYIPTVFYPATTSDSFVWPESANSLIEELMVLSASSALLSTKDGASNGSLESRKGEIVQQLKSFAPSVTIIPLRKTREVPRATLKYYQLAGQNNIQLCV